MTAEWKQINSLWVHLKGRKTIYTTHLRTEPERRRLRTPRLLPVCDLLGKSLIAKESVNVKSGVFPVIYRLRLGVGWKIAQEPDVRNLQMESG